MSELRQIVIWDQGGDVVIEWADRTPIGTTGLAGGKISKVDVRSLVLPPKQARALAEEIMLFLDQKMPAQVVVNEVAVDTNQRPQVWSEVLYQ